LGTSGGYADDVKLGDVLFTKLSVGLDGLANYYPIQYNDKELQLMSQLRNHLRVDFAFIQPYSIGMPWMEDERLLTFAKPACTFTCQGFYNPQGRKLWQDGASILDVLGRFNDGEHRLDNFEMETSGIYALSRYHGFSALSLSLILAHRKRKEFIDEVPKRMNEFLDQGLDYMALTENN